MATVLCWNSHGSGAGGKPATLRPPDPAADRTEARSLVRGRPLAIGGGAGNDGIREGTGGVQGGAAIGWADAGPSGCPTPIPSGTGGANGGGGGTVTLVGATRGTAAKPGFSAVMDFSGEGLTALAGAGATLATGWPHDLQNRAF